MGMDKYLESLVLKGEAATEEMETADVNPEDSLLESDTDAQTIEAESECDIIEDSITEVEDQLAESDESDADGEDIEKQAADADTVTATSEDDDAEVDTSASLYGKPIAVNKIKVFNTPDPKGFFKIFSGNIIPTAKVESMYAIDYVKPGFGLVRGYVTDVDFN